ncbi:TPA: AbrB/MazE/SpoVT family DNA-binding domain-containing protein [Candidatus Bathyarchaeota archaeon]|nr:AbrB/MazE/SpoVT family DNA-binding domain-containing protein [Candidatus Bathyarchaeota archaeon]
MKSIIAKGKVGKKGEIYIGKRARGIAGLKPDSKVLCVAKEGEILIKVIPDPLDLLELPPVISVSVEEVEKESEGMQREQLKHLERELGRATVAKGA